MARGKSTSGRTAAFSLRAPASSGTPALEDPMVVVRADWADRAVAAPAPADIRRARRSRAMAATTACLIAGAGWLGASGGVAQAAIGDPADPTCEPGIALALSTAPPSTVANDGSASQRYSFTICARQSVERIQARIAKLRDPRVAATPANLESVTPFEVLPDLYGTRSWGVPTGLAAGSYAVEVAYFTPDGQMADRAASVFRVSQAAVPPPLPPLPPAPPLPAPPPQGPVSLPDLEAAPPPATPRAEAPRRAKLSLTKRANKRIVEGGSRVTWTLQLRNLGPAIARKVVLCDAVPGGLILVRAPRAQFRAGKACWTFPKLAKGGTRVVRIVTQVDGALSSTRFIVNRADAVAANAARVRANARVIGVPSTKKTTPSVTG